MAKSLDKKKETKKQPAKTMKEKKYEMCPYVNEKGETPESGIVEFLETPRFSTGYAALFNTLGFVIETHMWKPYNDRVWSTYELLKAMIEKTQLDARYPTHQFLSSLYH